MHMCSAIMAVSSEPYMPFAFASRAATRLGTGSTVSALTSGTLGAPLRFSSWLRLRVGTGRAITGLFGRLNTNYSMVSASMHSEIKVTSRVGRNLTYVTRRAEQRHQRALDNVLVNSDAPEAL